MGYVPVRAYESSMMNKSAVTEDYLKLIYAACEWGGDPISVSGLASKLHVAASTASENVRKLTESGFIKHVPYRGIELTDKGLEVALRMVRRHRLLESYLVEKLGFEWDNVHDEAEVLEHAASDALIDAMDRALGFPKRDPHGDPIPAADGSVEHPNGVCIVDMEEGQSGVVARISDESTPLLRHLEKLGIKLDAPLKLVERQDFAGTYLVQVGDSNPIELAQPAAISVWVCLND